MLANVRFSSGGCPRKAGRAATETSAATGNEQQPPRIGSTLRNSLSIVARHRTQRQSQLFPGFAIAPADGVSCLTLLEIGDACNLDCPVCYAGSGTARQSFRS